jgi:hypothetical protein
MLRCKLITVLLLVTSCDSWDAAPRITIQLKVSDDLLPVAGGGKIISQKANVIVSELSWSNADGKSQFSTTDTLNNRNQRPKLPAREKVF